MKFLASLALAVTLVILRIDLAAQLASKPQVQKAQAGNSASDQTETANTNLTVHSNVVFLPTRVQKKNGETIYGLKPEQFIIEDNGVPGLRGDRARSAFSSTTLLPSRLLGAE